LLLFNDLIFPIFGIEFALIYNESKNTNKGDLMKVFMYRAALHCETCGGKIKDQLNQAGKQPEDIDNEYSYDSDDYPKGPYSDGGGEADCPQYCDTCGIFLENPLTHDGIDYEIGRIETNIFLRHIDEPLYLSKIQHEASGLTDTEYLKRLKEIDKKGGD
jgi:hypothetical protein